MFRRSIVIAAALTMSASARARAQITMSPIPSAHGAPWAQVFQSPGFEILADTQHVTPVPDEGGVLVWFVTLHAKVQHAKSLTFNRARLRLLVRCKPFAFRSVSQELALDDNRPVSHLEWTWRGPGAEPWRVPEAGGTDDVFLRRTCALMHSEVH